MRSDRRIFAIGFALSVALHAAGLWAFRSGPARTEQAPARAVAMTLVALPAAADPPRVEEILPPVPAPVQLPVTPPSLAPATPPAPAPAPATPPVIALLTEPGAPAPAHEPPRSDAPPPSPPPLNPAAERMERGKYEQTVAHWLERYRDYPLAARRRGWEGTAIVRLRLAADGSLLLAQIVRHTGHSLLDQAALGMIERAAPFPRLPEAVTEGQIEILIPIQFSLGS